MVPYVGEKPALSAEFECFEVDGLEFPREDGCAYSPVVWNTDDTPPEGVLIVPDSAEATRLHREGKAYTVGPDGIERAIRSVMSGAGWNPCMITGIQKVKGAITLSVYTPVCPLVIDGDHGFTLEGGEITTPPRVSASADNMSTVVIGVDGGGKLRYTPGGVRDSSPDRLEGRPLYNWLCSDEFIFKGN
jgi:hypothetical protein